MRNSKNIRIGEALGFGFNAFFSNILLFVGVFLMLLVYSGIIMLLIGLIGAFKGMGMSLVILIFTAFLLVVGSVVYPVGAIRINLDLYDYGKSSVNVFYTKVFESFSRGCTILAMQMFAGFALLFSFAIGSTIILIIVSLFNNFILYVPIPKNGFGLTLLTLLLPMVVIYVRFLFAPYLVVDKNLGAMDSLRQSWHITKGNTIRLFLFKFVSFFIACIPFLFPAASLSQVYVYRQLLSDNKDEDLQDKALAESAA